MKIEKRIIQINKFSYSKFYKNEDREDFAAWAVLKTWERVKGKKTQPTLKNLYIDYLRHLNDDRSKGFEDRKKIYNAMPSIETIMDFPDECIKTHKHDSIFSDSIKTLRGGIRIIFILLYGYGWTIREVAFLFGLNDTRICQLRNKCIKILRHKYVRKDEYE